MRSKLLAVAAAAALVAGAGPALAAFNGVVSFSSGVDQSSVLSGSIALAPGNIVHVTFENGRLVSDEDIPPGTYPGMFTFDDDRMRRASYTVGEDGTVSVAGGAATLGGPTVDLGFLGQGHFVVGAGPIVQSQWRPDVKQGFTVSDDTLIQEDQEPKGGGGQLYGGVNLGQTPWGTNFNPDSPDRLRFH